MKFRSTKPLLRNGILVTRTVGFVLVMSALSMPASATPALPEIDPGVVTSAMALLGGGLLMIGRRSRRSR
jgi:hypothetical protein